jgi:antitoxin YefM
MTAVSLDVAKDTLGDLMHRVAMDHEPVLIEAADATPAVLVSLEDFKNWDTTAYLMSDRRTRETLLRRIQDMDAGKGVVRELIDEHE